LPARSPPSARASPSQGCSVPTHRVILDRSPPIHSAHDASPGPLDPSQRRAVTLGKPIVIERNVGIATAATIIGGVTVGENSVVAAGSVVTKSVPPNTLVAGIPARVIRSIGDDREDTPENPS
jgi:acetyltransferase-like isoleucine patch superfamily enzyme